MKEMIIQVSSTKSTFGVMIEWLLALFVAITSFELLALVLPFKIWSFLYIVLFAYTLGVSGLILEPFKKHFMTQAFELKITKKGVKIAETNASFLIEWEKVKYIDAFNNGENMRALRIFPKKGAFDKMNLTEETLSRPVDEILDFIHEVCPLGRNISFWTN